MARIESVFLVVHSDYDDYDIYGVYLSRADAERNLRRLGFRVYKSGRKKGLWSRRDFSYGLSIDDYELGWRDEEEARTNAETEGGGGCCGRPDSPEHGCCHTGITQPRPGLYKKFDVRRIHGQDKSGEEFFVLSPTHDPLARNALTLYAELCLHSGLQELGLDLVEALHRCDQGESFYEEAQDG